MMISLTQKQAKLLCFVLEPHFEGDTVTLNMPEKQRAAILDEIEFALFKVKLRARQRAAQRKKDAETHAAALLNLPPIEELTETPKQRAKRLGMSEERLRQLGAETAFPTLDVADRVMRRRAKRLGMAGMKDQLRAEGKLT